MSLLNKMTDKQDISQTIENILKSRKIESLQIPDSIKKLLEGINFEKSEKIDMFYIMELEETSFGAPSVPKYKPSQRFFEEDGICIGALQKPTEGNAYDAREEGYKLYLLKGNRLALFRYTLAAKTSGRISGPGYTGSEETTTTYKAELEKIVQL